MEPQAQLGHVQFALVESTDLLRVRLATGRSAAARTRDSALAQVLWSDTDHLLLLRQARVVVGAQKKRVLPTGNLVGTAGRVVVRDDHFHQISTLRSVDVLSQYSTGNHTHTTMVGVIPSRPSCCGQMGDAHEKVLARLAT